MIMELKEFNYPSFFMFPYHTDRTAWQDFGLPMILVVPHVRDATGTDIANSKVLSASIYISEKGKAPVAGHDHIGIFNPDFEIYRRDITELELLARHVDLRSVTFLDEDGNTTTAANAENIKFVCKAGIEGQVKYLEHADYIDVSDIKLPVEQLPSDRYILTYEAVYYRRTISENNELLCIDEPNTAVAKYRFLLNHPGEVLMMMVESTPGLYFGQKNKSEDDTILFYRPFSEILQDAHDEQNYLGKVNWVYDIPHEHIPYLGFLLGWELPYFPRSVDGMRRAVLRNITKLQQLKGTKRAVHELFDLFGFAANVANIWWTPDGLSLRAPGEDAVNYEIDLVRTATTEPLLMEYVEDGFAHTTVPFIHRPVRRLATIRAYVAEQGSAAHTYLRQVGLQLASDFDALDYEPANRWSTLSSGVSNVESLAGLTGSTTALIDQDGYVSDITTSGDAPLLASGLKHDNVSNILDLTLSRHYEFETDETVLYVFATYVYDKIAVPASMQNLQSNRFDITILKKSGEQVEPDVVLFLVDFLFRIKAFHSILRKVIIALLASDTYQVTDFCVGGRVQQDIDVDAGKQQTPPEAIIPVVPGNCFAYKPEDYGYRRWDIEYRKRVLADLQIEFDAWAALDDDCGANQYGQDRSRGTREQETDLTDAVRSDEDIPRQTLCELDGEDYCYLGRPHDQAAYSMVAPLPETWRFNPCDLGMGDGVYYTYPKSGFLGNEIINPYIGNPGSEFTYKSWMGRLYRAYGRTQDNSLHYSGNRGLDDSDQKHRWLALRRPELGIQHDNLNFPGHRLPRMNALLDDFVSSEWMLKPWDFPLICDCGYSRYQNPLNATLEVGSNGSEQLVFDDAAYSIDENNVLPDIYTLGEHRVGSTETSLASADVVTHSIYADFANGHAAISFDGITQGGGITSITSEGTFGSAIQCGSTTHDYIEGYPATNGWLTGSDIPPTVLYCPACSDPDALMNAMGVPAGATSATLLFTMASQILVAPSEFGYDNYRHNRLDCGCVQLACADDSGASDVVTDQFVECTVAQFLANYGTADNDQVEYERDLVLPEIINAELQGVDDIDSSLFNLKQSNTTAGWILDVNSSEGPTPWPSEGSFTYKDDYETIHEVQWEVIGNYLDIITTTKEPRVWGVSYKTGRVINREMYRDGIITTTRHIFLYTGTAWELVALGTEQKTGTFKTTYICNAPFINPFVLIANHNIQDFLGWAVTCGSHWADPSEVSGENVVWSSVSGPGGNVQPLQWIDIFGVQDLTAVCP